MCHNLSYFNIVHMNYAPSCSKITYSRFINRYAQSSRQPANFKQWKVTKRRTDTPQTGQGEFTSWHSYYSIGEIIVRGRHIKTTLQWSE